MVRSLWGDELVAVGGCDCEFIPVWSLRTLWEQSTDNPSMPMPPMEVPTERWGAETRLQSYGLMSHC